MFRSLRNAFITGIVVILPLGVTIILIKFLLVKLGNPASQLFFWYFDSEWRNLPSVKFALETTSVFVVFSLITVFGYGSRFVLGRIILNGLERLLDQVPFINTVYRSVKQIVETFGKENRAVFKEVVLVEYPRPNCFVIGFLTNEASGETVEVIGKSLTNVFVPTNKALL